MGKGVKLGENPRIDSQLLPKIWWRHLLQSATVVQFVAGCRLNPFRYV
jgi:hypothetical protein